MENESSQQEIILDGVYKAYRNHKSSIEALDNVSISIPKGEFTCLIGPSGCGKSTLLSLVAGLEFPDRGGIFVGGKPVTRPGNDRTVLFQEAALFPWLNVIDNVLFGIKLKNKISSAEQRELAEFYLRLVGLEKFMHAQVYQLSGGMKQRVALARALAPNPEVLLMDEPFAALDALTREQLYTDMQRIWQEQPKTILFVTHNVMEAACLGDRVILFSPHPGRIKQEFKIPLPRPRDIRDLEVAKYSIEITHGLRSKEAAV